MPEIDVFTFSEIFRMCLIVCPLVFLAGFVDSIAGGGGLISTPAYMLTGIAMQYVLGCNKAMSSLGLVISSSRYIKNKTVNWRAAAVCAVGSFIGSAAGSQIALRIDSASLKKFFIFVLPFVAVFVLLNKNKNTGEQKLFGAKMSFVCFIIGCATGLYDGLIGPGAGTFMIIGLTAFIGFDYITASGSAKIVNLASNISALISFIFAGKIIWALAIPAAVFNMAGCYLGSGYAIKYKDTVVKKVMVLVLIGIFVKLIIDIL